MYGFFLVWAVAVVGMLVSLYRPLIGLYIYVGFAVLRPQYIWGFAGDLTGVSFWVGVSVLAGWAVKRFGSWKLARARGPILVLCVFASWYVLSATQALNTDRGFGAVQELAKTVLPLLVGVTMMNSAKEWRPMFWTIVLAQGYVGFEANNNYLFKGVNTAAEGFGGADNNFFGLTLVTVIGPAIALMTSARTWYARGLAGAAAALMLHATLLTYSRGAMIGLLAVGAVAFVMMPKRPKHLAALLLVALLALRFTGPELWSRYASAFVGEEQRDSSAESRLELWTDCMRVVGDYPILGVGPSNWRVIASRYGWPEGKSAHSVWMESAAELGVPGVLAYLMIFALTAIKLWPVARARPTATNADDIAMATGLVLSIVGFVVSGQFVSVQGVELPYYVAMTGMALLKGTSPAIEAASAPARVAIARRPLGVVAVRPAADRRSKTHLQP